MTSEKCIGSNTMSGKCDSLQEVIYLPPLSNNEKNVQELTPENVNRRKDTLFLYFVVLTGAMPIIVGAGSLVWTSPVVPKLSLNDSTENPIGRPATTTEVSLIAGLPPLTMVFGSFLVGKLSELIGRKACLQTIGLGMFLSGIIVAFSTNVVCIIVFRCTLYMFYNGVLTVLPIYITEICEDHNRAKFGCLMGAFLPLGNLYSYILGTFFNVRNYSLLLAAPLGYFLVFFFFCPESLVYLLKQGRKKQCVRAVKRLRCNKTDKERDIDVRKIEETLKESSKVSNGSIFKLFSTRELRFAVLLAVGPILVQNLSGVTVVISFMAPIFNEAGYSGNYMSIIVGLVKVSTITFTSFIVEKAGRRTMLIISATGTGIPLFALGCFFYLKEVNSPWVSYIQWLPFLCIVSNVVMYALGLGSIPMAIMGELFTPDMRAAAVSFVTAVMGFAIFATTTSYPFIAEFVGIHWCVWMYSFICMIGAIFIYVMIPETKGKSLLEIQEYVITRKM